MPHKLKADDLAGASIAMLDLLAQESEKRLNAQAQLMISADARASAILAASVALTAAALAVAAQTFTKEEPLNPLAIMSATFALFTLTASVATFSALWPTRVQTVGWTAATLLKDIQSRKSERAMKAEMVVILHGRVKTNRECALRLGFRIKVAMLALTLAAPSAAAAGVYQPDGVGGLVAAVLAALTLSGTVYFSETLKR